MTQLKIDRMRILLSELYEIKKRPFAYAVRDLDEWMSKKLDEVGYLLDDIENELDPEYPDQQRILNYEHEMELEKGVVRG